LGRLANIHCLWGIGSLSFAIPYTRGKRVCSGLGCEEAVSSFGPFVLLLSVF
jgi:hypothetical protein